MHTHKINFGEMPASRRSRRADLLPRSPLQSPCRDQRWRLGRRCPALRHRTEKVFAHTRM